MALNPVFGKSLHGLNAPNVKIAYDFTPKVTGGIEYYGGLGTVGNLSPISEQRQQILPAIDLNLSPKWEINFGLGVGFTRGTDHLLFKTIVGYRFDSFPIWPNRNTAGKKKTRPVE